MELKFVVPNMEKTFGNLEFAGEHDVTRQRVNNRSSIVSRSYNLYSDVQRADDIVVVLPAKAGEKTFEPEQRVSRKAGKGNLKEREKIGVADVQRVSA